MKICSTHSKFKKKMSKICGFDRVSKTESKLQHFNRNCKINNFDDFEQYEADAY